MIINPDDPEGDPISQRANLPDDLPPDELTPEFAEKLFSTPQEGRSLGVDPVTGHEIVAKEGRFGPYVTEVLPEPPDADDGRRAARRRRKKAAGPKPRTGSLFKSMDLAEITLDDALKLLSLPRVVGIDPDIGRGDHRAERPLRPVSEEGHRLPVAGHRGSDLHGHPRRGAEDLRRAQASRTSGSPRAAAA